MVKKVVPLGDRLLVQFRKPKSETLGGIALPDTAQTKEHVATILDIGPDVKNVKQLKKGLEVFVGMYAGTETPEDEYVRLVKEEDIHGVYP